MNKKLEDALDEFDRTGSLSRERVEELTHEIEGGSPYDGISVAADCHATGLASIIAKRLDHDDQMVRWMAIGTLLRRFELEQYASAGLTMAGADSSLMVRGEALSGLGAVLAKVSDRGLKKRCAEYLKIVAEDQNEIDAMRQDAYAAILTAMEEDSEEASNYRTPFNPQESVDPIVISRFVGRFLD